MWYCPEKYSKPIPNLNEEFDKEDSRGWRYSLSFNFVQRYKPGKEPVKQPKGHNSGGGVFADELENTDEWNISTQF